MFIFVGAVNPDRRKISPFHLPWQFTDEELQVHTRLTKIQFFDFVEKCRGANLKQRELNLFSQCLVFKMKMAHETTNDQLASFFKVDEKTIRRCFLRILMHQFMHRNNIPVLIRPDGTVNDEERNKLFDFAHNNTPDYFKRLVQEMEDPTGRQRVGVLLNMDATYFYSQGSSDIHHQKQVYCSFKSHHIIKFMNVTDMRGKFLAVIPLATSQSPASGDHHLLQRFSSIEDNNIQQENYLRCLLAGTDTYFCVMVVDAGFVTDLRNKPREIQGAPTLADLCNDAGALLFHTSETNEAYVFTRNAANNITKDFSDNPEVTQVENRIKLTRVFRTVQEQIHASLKRRYSLLNSKFIPNSYLRPLSPAQLARFNLPDSYGDVPLLTYMTVVCCSMLNTYHPGYGILYLDPEDQVQAAERLLTRLFTVNPLLHNIWPSDMNFDSPSGGNWVISSFRMFHGLNLFPALESHQINPVALDLVSGPHALLKAQSLLTYMGQLNIRQQNLNLTRLQTQQYLEQPPYDWPVQYCKIKTPDDFLPTAGNPRWCPSWYDEDQFGTWHDITFVRARIPPSMKSATSISNFHYAVIGFGEESSDHLRLLPPYDRIFTWKCFRCPAKNGSLSMCRHLATLLLAISFPQEYRSTYKPVNLLSAVEPEARQLMRILPPTTESRTIPLNIERRSRNTRQNLTFYDLSQTPRASQANVSTAGSTNTPISTNASSSTGQQSLFSPSSALTSLSLSGSSPAPPQGLAPPPPTSPTQTPCTSTPPPASVTPLSHGSPPPISATSPPRPSTPAPPPPSSPTPPSTSTPTPPTPTSPTQPPCTSTAPPASVTPLSHGTPPVSLAADTTVTSSSIGNIIFISNKLIRQKGQIFEMCFFSCCTIIPVQ